MTAAPPVSGGSPLRTRRSEEAVTVLRGALVDESEVVRGHGAWATQGHDHVPLEPRLSRPPDRRPPRLVEVACLSENATLFRGSDVASPLGPRTHAL
jgi:hypothetical protein